MANAPSHPTVSRSEYLYHEKTFHGFLHVVRWFLMHIALLLSGLYFGVIQGAVAGAWFLIAVAIVALGMGLLTTPRASRRESEDAVRHMEANRQLEGSEETNA